jgi:hypothetical protein
VNQTHPRGASGFITGGEDFHLLMVCEPLGVPRMRHTASSVRVKEPTAWNRCGELDGHRGPPNRRRFVDVIGCQRFGGACGTRAYSQGEPGLRIAQILGRFSC